MSPHELTMKRYDDGHDGDGDGDGDGVGAGDGDGETSGVLLKALTCWKQIARAARLACGERQTSERCAR